MPSGKPKLGADDISIKKLKEEYMPLISAFSCAGKDEEDFLKKDALQHQKLGLSETFLLIENNGNKLISYITLSFGSFQMSENTPLGGIPIIEKQTHIFSTHMPCLLIGKLATDKNCEGRGGATFLLEFAAQTGVKINAILALPFMALHSRPDKVQYYKNRDFLIAFSPDKKGADTITMCRSLMEKCVNKP